MERLKYDTLLHSIRSLQGGTCGMLKFERYKLDNGILVYLIPMDHVGSVIQFCVVRGGSNYEPKKDNGVSHFLEHMLFKGTARRPTARDVSFEIEALGATNNAFTGSEYIAFYINGPSRFFVQISDILSDQILHSSVDPEEIEKEKGAVVQEMRMYESNPQQRVLDLLPPLIYGDQPAGRLIVGTEESVRALEREQLCAYMAKFFTRENMLVVCAGKLPSAHETLAILDQFYGEVPSGKRPRMLPIKDTPQRVRPGITIEAKNNPDTWVALSFRGPAVTAKTYAAVRVLNTLLGIGTSSRLFLEVREKRGLAYAVSTDLDGGSKDSILTVYMGVNPARLQEALDAARSVLQSITQEQVPENELAKARNLIEGGLSRGLEQTRGAAQYVALNAMRRGALLSPERYLRTIARVNADEIKTIAAGAFHNSNMNIGIVGPHGGQEEAVLDSISF